MGAYTLITCTVAIVVRSTTAAVAGRCRRNSTRSRRSLLIYYPMYTCTQSARYNTTLCGCLHIFYERFENYVNGFVVFLSYHYLHACVQYNKPLYFFYRYSYDLWVPLIFFFLHIIMIDDDTRAVARVYTCIRDRATPLPSSVVCVPRDDRIRPHTNRRDPKTLNSINGKYSDCIPPVLFIWPHGLRFCDLICDI